MIRYITLLTAILFLTISCSVGSGTESVQIANSAANLTSSGSSSAAIPSTDIELPTENEKAALIDKTIAIFGIKILALEEVTSRDLKLVANVLAQWIDNDEDRIPDNPAVLAEIVKRNSRMILGVTFDQIGPWHENSQRMLKNEHAPTYGLDVTSINHNWYGLPPSKYSEDHYHIDGLCHRMQQQRKPSIS